VLEPYAGKSQYSHQGQRVVLGQRLMQSSSDIFLGWTRSPGGRDYFVRQLRDMKLARAHAKSGNAATISGYLGKGDAFDQALGTFALLIEEE